MKQVLVIHGGDSFATYEEYIAYLKNETVSLEDGQRRGWKAGLSLALGEGYQVISPRMPNSYNAKYEEWRIWFLKYAELLSDDIILIGHSLGGSFLAKFLSTEKFPRKITATFLIAPPYDTDGPRALVEFNSPESLQALLEQGGQLYLYHSKDDSVVDFKEFEKFKKALPTAHFEPFEDRGHFIGEEFPEIVKDIQNL